MHDIGPSPARGRPVVNMLLCLAAVVCFQVILLGDSQKWLVYMPCFSGLERFSYGRGRSRPSIIVATTVSSFVTPSSIVQ